jgi:hypothetical protein
MLTRWLALDERIAAFDAEFAVEAKRDEAARRLTSIPGMSLSGSRPDRPPCNAPEASPSH